MIKSFNSRSAWDSRKLCSFIYKKSKLNWRINNKIYKKLKIINNNNFKQFKTFLSSINLMKNNKNK